MEGTRCILVSHLSLVQIWWDGALTWRLGREVLMHTAETSKAWDSLLPEAQGKLLRENGVSPGQTAVTKQPRNPEALTLGFMA